MKEILLASPRGFCAGVDRAIDIVRLALEKFDQPIYVRHEIVHNKHVVQRLEEEGATFVETLDEVPDGAIVIFSAHGVPKEVVERAESRGLKFINATCPLVTKVHLEAEKYYNQGYHVVLIGHEGHPEVEGTMGQIPERIYLIGSQEEIEDLPIPREAKVAYLTQTTLSVDETKDIIEGLENHFPNIEGPSQEDICYATQNRQDAVKKLAHDTNFVYILGSANSSNTKRLVEVAQKHGAPARRIQDASELRFDEVKDSERVGISAGASAPEDLVKEVITDLKERFPSAEKREVTTVEEDMEFVLPDELKEHQPA